VVRGSVGHHSNLNLPGPRHGQPSGAGGPADAQTICKAGINLCVEDIDSTNLRLVLLPFSQSSKGHREGLFGGTNILITM